MKLLLCCHPTQGGSGVVASELAAALAARGHEVHLVACQRPFRLDESAQVAFHRVNVPDYPLFRYPPHDLSLANKLSGVVKEHGIQIIHAHYAVPHAVAALLARDVVRPHPVRIVTTLHGTDITLVGSHRDFHDLTRHAMLQSDAVTAVSRWLQHETVSRFSLPAPPETIPNFVDPTRFSARGRAAYPDAGEPFHVVHASNLRPVKRVLDTLRAFRLIRDELGATLTIVGEGPQRAAAERLAAELQIDEHVSFEGARVDMPRILRSAHLLFLLSKNESFGLSALEAMACGTPAVVSAVGGLPEVVVHGETGLLCPVGEPERAGKVAARLLGDRDRWTALSTTAAAHARDRFGADVVVGRYEALYERLLAAC